VRVMAIVNAIGVEASTLVAATAQGAAVTESRPMANLTFPEQQKKILSPEPVTIPVRVLTNFMDKYSRILWIIGLFFLGIIALAGLFYILQWFK